MIKRLVLASVLASLLLPATSANAQYWNPSGNNIYNTNSGNVGIGTSAPASKLDVRSGNINIANNYAYSIFDPSGIARVAFQMDTLGNQIVGAGTVSTGGDLVLRAQGFLGGAMRIKANTGFVGVGTTNPGARFEVADGVIKSYGNRGTVTTQYITTPGWYTQSVVFPYPFGTAPVVTFTQYNTGGGDISIISTRIANGTLSNQGFQIDYYVNAVPYPGTTKFNWIAIE